MRKTHYFPQIVHYCCQSMPSLSETLRWLPSSSFWEAKHALIGQLSSALWLAEYLKRATEIYAQGRTLQLQDRIYAPTDCNTPKRKENLKSHHMTPLSEFGTNAVHTVHVINNTFYSLFENSLRGIPELRSCITVILPRLFFTAKW